MEKKEGREMGEKQAVENCTNSTTTTTATASAAKKKEMRVESLGWLTESTVMPKKHKAIEGVGASSILELKAQLYRSQQEAKSSKQSDDEYQRAKSRIVHLDISSRKNSGVDARAHRDKLELKAERDGSVSYAALERKAELYEKLARGDLPDEEDKEKYCVDFFQKSIIHDPWKLPERNDTKESIPEENEDAKSDSTVLNIRPFSSSGHTSLAVDNDEHKRLVREVHEEVSEAREKVSTLKLRRQEEGASRREKLRQAYLRKQFEKLKAANAGKLS